MNGNSKCRNRPVGEFIHRELVCFLGGVPESRAGNVVTSQPHVPRLVRVGIPLSSLRYRMQTPGKDQKCWLGVQGQSPCASAKQTLGFGASAPIITCKDANKCSRGDKNVGK